MAGEPENAEDAATRLEAALERIAGLIGAKPANSIGETAENMGDSAAPAEEIAARLDKLIDRLRAALNGSPTERSG